MRRRRVSARGRVVLLGGGYVTVYAYRELARRLRRPIRAGRVEIVIVSADDCHSFHGFTGEVLAGALPVSRTRTPLAEACPAARLVQGRVECIDAERRLVTYVDGDGRQAQLSYDHIVVGLGGREPVESLPGLAEHGFTLRGLGDIERLEGAVSRLAAECPDSGDPRTDGLGRHSVVVAGGGLAGAELAAAVALRGAGRLRVELVHSGPALLPALRNRQPRLARSADAELARLGVVVRPNVRLARVTPLGAHLSDGAFVPAAAVIGTIGQRPVAPPGLPDGLRDDRGRLITREDLSVTGSLWAAGDCARVHRQRSSAPVPANALWAIKAGGLVGRNIARRMRGSRTRAFRYPGLGQAASFGPGRAIAELYGVPITGAVAWLLRLVFFLRFMPTRRAALGVLKDLNGRSQSTRSDAAPSLAAGPRQERSA